jgi:hypothetical protein
MITRTFKTYKKGSQNMSTIKTQSYESSDPRLQSADELVASSLRRILQQVGRKRQASAKLFGKAYIGLDALPLATGIYSQAKLNLRNAERYVTRKEWGAARFELTLLLRRLIGSWSRTAVKRRPKPV